MHIGSIATPFRVIYLAKSWCHKIVMLFQQNYRLETESVHTLRISINERTFPDVFWDFKISRGFDPSPLAMFESTVVSQRGDNIGFGDFSERPCIR